MAEKRKQVSGKREVVEMMLSGADKTSLVTNRMKKLYEDSRMNQERQDETVSPEGQAADTFQEQAKRAPQEGVRGVRTLTRTSERFQRVKEVREVRRERLKGRKGSFAEMSKTVPSPSAGERMKAAAMKPAGETAKQAGQTGIAVAKNSSTIITRLKQLAVTSVKAIATGIRSGVALIGALGGTTIIVILVICMAAMIFGSAYGIFFTGAESGERTIRTVMAELDAEYELQVLGIRGSCEYDILEMHGKRPEWKDVLSVYAVKTNLDPNDPDELITMTSRKEQKLRDVYWDMCSVSFNVETGWRMITITVVDKDGKEVEKKVLREVTVLSIRTDSATAQQMSSRYFFNWEQRELLGALMDRGNDMFWSGIIP